jgi:midasin
MDVSRCSAQLLDHFSHLHEFPEELSDLLHQGSNEQYLDTLSQLALNPTHTIAVFATHEGIFAEICSRWLTNTESEDLFALAALAIVLPSAPHLSVYAGYLLNRKRGILEALASRDATALHELPTDTLRTLLLALGRLLKFDNQAFAPAISPAKLQMLLNHVQPYIRYLAIRLICLYLHASDAALLSMINSYIGEDGILGPWEDKTIDYSFFSLWEQERLIYLGQMLQLKKEARGVDGPGRVRSNERMLTTENFSATTACIAGILVPRLNEKDPGPTSLVMTGTTRGNIHSFAEAVNSSKPLLVTGCSGTGKTSIITDVARELGKSSSMVTLHLNGQTDAKSLVGVYTNAKTPGSFSWSPGVLTTAVTEGRWLIIEDLDRAPTEIVSTLAPLLERRELFLPNGGETIKAAAGFKLIATIRSTINTRGEEVIPIAGMLGTPHWLQVPLKVASDSELAEIVTNKFSLLHAYIPKFMAVYQILIQQDSPNASKTPLKTSVSRPFGPQDLLRWCGRVQDLLSSAGIIFGNEPISDALNDHIFLEAVDCFLGAYALGSQRAHRLDLIAQGLHMPAERVKYCLEGRKPDYFAFDSAFRIGRTTLPKRQMALGVKSPSNRFEYSPFATTKHVIRILESIAVAVKRAEPCLLVGETGTGKTTVVQRLADALGQKLTVVNLSQQSEVGDLLGGYKPVNMRALAIPMKEDFDELLDLTFTSKRNQRYVELLGKSISKGRWARALALWQEALRMTDERFKPTGQNNDQSINEPLSKKRKVEASRVQKLKSRWDKFASDVSIFQKHLASGSKGFAFSFIEGNIVKAARNGEWVLLDEINLASPDTLESLADLLSQTVDGRPSILLTESGNAERIYAHRDFRIFGAMNPATDIGKRDLPMGLRSRFTELFIEAPDKDLENLVPVVKAYLGENHVDVRAATDVAQLYIEIKRLVDANQLVDGAKQKPHFSLRTLTRTLLYVSQNAPFYGLRRALFEGFSMSFMTSLDRESELLLKPLIDKHILAGQRNSGAILHQTPHPPKESRDYIQFKHYWILRGAQPIEPQAQYIITPFIERNLLNLVRATSTRKFPILLQGPTSSGKTSMVDYLARISGNNFVRINNHEHTDLQEYLGSYVSGPDGRLQYQEGVLVQALREGYWVVLDELNLAPTDVLEALNRLLDDNRELLIPETQQMVRPHPDFMLFATQNPPGMYGGRKVLSRAFRNRFLELHFDDIPEDELETILRERSRIAPSFCKKMVKVYKELTKMRQTERLFEQRNSFVTLRDLFRWASREVGLQEHLAINGFLLLAERVRNQEERSVVKKIIEDVMNVKIDDSHLYGVARTGDRFSTSVESPLGVVWTKSMRRLYTLVTEALKNNEPVLLVGETGSGKTTICQLIAEMSNTKLYIVNAHQNMETGDLIGAQRPIRNKAHAEAQLKCDLRAALRESGVDEEDHEHELPELWETYAVLRRHARATVSDQMHIRVEESKRRVNSLFEWVDGSLVNAMRNGQHYLLDEISLADDSVLERLNSVLEPGRTLFLAEKGTADGLIKATPGFQFLATMNPGGDYGKRELSPALRNRFTEIWVPNSSSEEEMLEIVQAKLSPRMSRFAKAMITFAAWYSATYNAATPHISIRDLLTWVQFVNDFQHSDLRLTLFHGAAMVYIDGLGANPASKMVISENAVSFERRACVSKLTEAFGQDFSSLYDQDYRLCSTDVSFTIGPFGLARSLASGLDSRYSLHAPTTLSNAMKIARALQFSKSILVEGSPGVGKTTLVAALAQSIGMPLTRINLSDQTDLMDLFGSDVPIEGEEAGNFIWRDAPFLRAMQKGEWVLLDEMNLASQSVLEGLNACLDHRGQVYVSELNQTFKRHPDFIVFAAQNPHHQGGGRKGLPASFIDRFTVVYADNFNAEDLMTISSEVYPDISKDDRGKTLHSVIALNHALQVNRTLEAHGGPWEINLRDVLRWLHLMTSTNGLLPLASPADFQQLLFLQRFRTIEDATFVSKVLEQYISHDQSRTYFYGKCGSLLEIGLAVLPRDLKLQPSPTQGFQTSRLNLEIAESVMLCVQNQWPCLLVGMSGSGKSSMILQLASMVGAEVVQISLNAETDTLDMIGGYDQIDPQRAVVGFVRRLHECTCRDLITNLISVDGSSSYLGELESRLRRPAINLLDVLELVRTVAQEGFGPRYNNFVIECEEIIALAADDNRARFEWVDGILVKALKQGQWVVLDNANLCSPSVLDRLNSLLEPDGVLSVNEHRDPDGSAQLVKPHKDFRLFMTMDPRHGELSRAMRNRSIELFMPARILAPLINLRYSDCESSFSRFELFQAFDWNSMDETRLSRLLSIFFDHLTFSDLKIYRLWETQIQNGLNRLSPSKLLAFSKIAETYAMASANDGSIFHAIHDAYEQLGKELILTSSDFGSMQVSCAEYEGPTSCFNRSLRQSIHSTTPFYCPQKIISYVPTIYPGSQPALNYW